jgi:hypothetical protein
LAATIEKGWRFTVWVLFKGGATQPAGMHRPSNAAGVSPLAVRHPLIVLETRRAKTESFETQGRRYSGTAFLAMNWSSLVAVGPM